jgi:hypothetical protein
MTNAQDMAFRLLIKLDPAAAKKEADKIRRVYGAALGVTPATGPCWSCDTQQPLEALKGVRLTKCPCGAVHPHLTQRLVLHFFNPGKQAIYIANVGGKLGIAKSDMPSFTKSIDTAVQAL